MKGCVLVAGASGVIGASVAERFAREGWDVMALSRRAPILPAGVDVKHLAVDLYDAAQCREAVARCGPITLFVYAAVAEAPGLVSGWQDAALIARNRRMYDNIARPVAQAGALRWAGLLQGTKAYGAHVHPMEVPAREDRPRDPHANFYWEQEDILRDLAARHGFAWTIFRPQVLLGGAAGVVMNPVLPIGAYAAICRELALPFAYPALNPGLIEMTDAHLLANAHVWAAQAPAARDQIFNVTNGDVLVLGHAWPHLAEALGLPAGESRRLSFAEFLRRPDIVAAWERIVARHDLHRLGLSAFLGQSHHYLDLLLSDQVAGTAGPPPLVSTIKLRKAGFGDCMDSLDSLKFWLRRMAETRLLPADLLA